jgi:sodium transport system permease protein
MRWPNVEVIFRREVRDQLRDRRTLMMIFVLPLLLYPMIGIGTAKLGEAFKESVRTVVLVGPANLPETAHGLGAPAAAAGVAAGAAHLAPGPIALLNDAGDGFNPALFDAPGDARQIRVLTVPPAPPGPTRTSGASASAPARPTWSSRSPRTSARGSATSAAPRSPSTTTAPTRRAS